MYSKSINVIEMSIKKTALSIDKMCCIHKSHSIACVHLKHRTVSDKIQ